jgi:LuxR family transcriptional regulator, maltose regulon positive regulatory protein
MVEDSHPQTIAYELLRTKITPPRLRPLRVPRPTLLARLDEGLKRKLTLLSAPAGFGKTTLVTEWIARRDEEGDLPPVAWVSLDGADNDPVRFWRYLFTACQTFTTPAEKPVGETALTMLRTARQPPFEALLTAFINDLTQLAQPVILVLEDYHVIHAQPIHEMVAFLLDYLPATLHLLLISRRDPALPLARLRAQHEIHELRATDLRFSLDEIQLFLQQNVPFPLPSNAADLLKDRTEGWIAGLQLVTLPLGATNSLMQ